MFISEDTHMTNLFDQDFAVLASRLRIPNLQPRDRCRWGTLSGDAVVEVHFVLLYRIRQLTGATAAWMETYLLLPWVDMQGDRIGWLLSERRVGNVVSDLDLGNDGS